MVETLEREELAEFIESTAAMASLDWEGDLTEPYKEW